jgi:hypothetical protein
MSGYCGFEEAEVLKSVLKLSYIRACGVKRKVSIAKGALARIDAAALQICFLRESRARVG